MIYMVARLALNERCSSLTPSVTQLADQDVTATDWSSSCRSCLYALRVASTVHKNEMLLEHRVDTATLEAANKAVRGSRSLRDPSRDAPGDSITYRERELAAWNWAWRTELLWTRLATGQQRGFSASRALSDLSRGVSFKLIRRR